MDESIPVTQEFCRFLADVRFEDIPPDARHEAKRALLNVLGVGIAGAATEEADLLLAYAEEMGSAPKSPVWGRKRRVSPDHACLIHGAACHVLDFDDTHLKAMVHPSPPVAPVLFAVGTGGRLSGRDLLLSFLLGIEVELRLGEAANLKGFHPTAVLGNFGATVAAGKLLGLDASRLAHAFGVAATQAAGLVLMNGTMSKSFHVGKAAQNGFLAAKLAARGMTSVTTAIEDRFVQGYSQGFDAKAAVEGLGERFFIHKNSYKPYACGVVAHPAIDGAIQIRDESGLDPDHIRTVVCEVAPAVVRAMGISAPRDSLEAKFSTPHSVAVALLLGKASLSEYLDAQVKDSQTQALTAKVRLVADPSLTLDQARVRIELEDSETREAFVNYAKGSIQVPLSDDELNEKFRNCVEPILGRASTRALASCLWDIEECRDIGSLEQWMAG